MEVFAEVCVQFRLSAGSHPGGGQMAERIESLCVTTANGKPSTEQADMLFHTLSLAGTEKRLRKDPFGRN